MNNNLNFDYEIYHHMANAIRSLTIDAIEQANSGHPGLPLGMADVVTVLYRKFLKFNPHDPKWINRDRFVLSAGHGSMLLYSLLYLTGYQDITIEDIKQFRQLHSKCDGHPEFSKLAGVETSTGPLAQGLANAVGMAIAEQMLAARFGNIIDYYSYVLVGDGCLMEGLSYEAIALAGHLGLGKLIVLFDDNEITIDGSTSLSTSEDIIARFKSASWHVQTINGHNYKEIEQAIDQARLSDLPSIIACKTIIGYGSPSKAGTAKVHGAALGEKEAEATKKNLGLILEKFAVNEVAKTNWQQTQIKGINNYNDWQNQINKFNDDKRKDFDSFFNNYYLNNLDELIYEIKKLANKNEATRTSSQIILEELVKKIPTLIGGSADLTASNLTKTSYMQDFTLNIRAGNYINYGIREHAMAAVMNGISLSNLISYGGSFLAFSDYMRPSIRMAALMSIKTIYVMTHDSIGLGEDGPTHQPIEHLASLRAIPNLLVFRPADRFEVAEAWQIALQANQPSLLALTRQTVPIVRNENEFENLSQRGAYIISESKGELSVTIFATGSEVHIALKVQKDLELQTIGVRVISMPCWQLFELQSQEYKEKLLNNKSIKMAIEAASSMGWHKYIGIDGIFIGIDEFGRSGKYEDLFEYFNITAKYAIEKILLRIKGNS